MDTDSSTAPNSGDAINSADRFDEATLKDLHQSMQQTAVRDSIPTLAIVLLGVLVVYFSLRSHIESSWFEVWAACTVATLCLRFAILYTSVNTPIDRSRYSMILGSQILGGLVWAWLLVFWNNDLSLGLQTLFVLAPIVVSVGSVTSAGAWPPFAIAVVLSAKLPFFIGAAITQAPGVMNLVVPMAVFVLLDLALLRNYHRRVRESFEMRIRNQRLIDDLTAKNENLEQAQQDALQAVDAKTNFLARMSHELRTPINGVVGGADLLSRTELDESQNRLLDTVRRSGDQMLVLVNQLFDHSRIKHDDFVLTESAFDLADALHRVVSEFRASHEGALLTINIDSDFPQQMIGDCDRVEQVFRHVVNNALKFSNDGRVSIKVDRVLADNEPGKPVRIAVSDNGIGIAADKMKSVFTDLEQVDGSMSRHFGGTGLGLTLTRRLVVLMNGQLLVQSQEGIGSTFTLVLPLKQAEAAKVFPRRRKTDKPAGDGSSDDRADDSVDGLPVKRATNRRVTKISPPVNFNGVRVLLAEDNLVNQMLLESMLESLGCRVTLADDGKEALSAMLSDPFDIVFMDCQMPGMDGLQATIQARDKQVNVPIVAVTANALIGDRERCLEAGMTDYVTKPVTRETLAQMLSRYSGNSGETLRAANA